MNSSTSASDSTTVFRRLRLGALRPPRALRRREDVMLPLRLNASGDVKGTQEVVQPDPAAWQSAALFSASESALASLRKVAVCARCQPEHLGQCAAASATADQ